MNDLSNTWYLFTFKKDWADEFETFGLMLCDFQYAKRYFDTAKASNLLEEIAFGTNEFWKFDNYERFVECFTSSAGMDKGSAMYLLALLEPTHNFSIEENCYTFGLIPKLDNFTEEEELELEIDEESELCKLRSNCECNCCTCSM